MAPSEKPVMEVDQAYVIYKRDEDGIYWPTGPDGEVEEDAQSLAPHPRNPNRGDVEAIRESIDENGWYGVVTVQKSTGYAIAGNHRFFAAAGKGAPEIPVVVRDVDDETALRILLADNQVARRAELDDVKVEEILSGLTSLRGTGYDALLGAAQEADEAPEAREPGGEDEGDEGPGEVPDDAYTPTYGVMIVCQDEEHQRAVYEGLGVPDRTYPWFGAELRVVAV